jgi:hypothetical protein
VEVMVEFVFYTKSSSWQVVLGGVEVLVTPGRQAWSVRELTLATSNPPVDWRSGGKLDTLVWVKLKDTV